MYVSLIVLILKILRFLTNLRIYKISAIFDTYIAFKTSTPFI